MEYPPGQTCQATRQVLNLGSLKSYQPQQYETRNWQQVEFWKIHKYMKIKYYLPKYSMTQRKNNREIQKSLATLENGYTTYQKLWNAEAILKGRFTAINVYIKKEERKQKKRMKNFKQPNTTPQRTRNRKIKSQVSGKEIIKDQSRNKGNR